MKPTSLSPEFYKKLYEEIICKFDFDPEGGASFRFPKTVEEIPSVRRSVLKYHSLGRRLWSRLMYAIYG